MEFEDSSVALLAASSGDTVKLFDISAPGDHCTLCYTPFPRRNVHSVKWNHTNLVVASAGDDKRISLWSTNGQTMGFVPASGTSSSDTIEESIMAINFSNKSSRYICSGGTGKIVRVWDMQRKRCIKWLRGHSNTVTGVAYNCKDEHLGSISLKGDLILHNLASNAKATEFKDPNEQVLRLIDFSRVSRHLLVVAGDDGSMHLWDTTGRNPKGSWLKQHSAPASGLSFSPSNDKVIVSVGLDKRFYTFDIGCRRPTSCIPYEVPFSSLAFRDDGLIVAAGTINGRVVFYDMRGKPKPFTVLYAYSEAVTSLCWQRSKPVSVTKSSYTADIALLGCTSEDSVLMPDPLPYTAQSVDINFPTTSEETPFRNHLRPGGALAKLDASRSGYTFKDDMDVFSPLVDVQPITSSVDRFWGDMEGSKKDSNSSDKKLSFLLSSSSSRKHHLRNDEVGERPIFDWNTSSATRQGDTTTSISAPSSISEACSLTPREAWGGEMSSDDIFHHRQTVNLPYCFSSLASGSMFSGPQDQNYAEKRVLDSSPSISHMEDTFSSAAGPSEVPNNGQNFMTFSAMKNVNGESKVGSLPLSSMPLPHKFPTYLERMVGTASFSDGGSLLSSSPVNKAGSESGVELLRRRRDLPDGQLEQPVSPKTSGPGTDDSVARKDENRGSSFSSQLFQHTLQEMLIPFQNCLQDDIRNIHIEVLRQSHMHEMEMSSVSSTILENISELMKEVKNLRKEVKQLSQLR